MTPGDLPLTIYQGADWSLRLTWRDDDDAPYDLTGWTFRMQIRDQQNNLLLTELSTANGKIVVGSNSPNITLAIPRAETAAFGWVWGIYDLDPTEPGGLVWPPLLRDRVIVVQEITR